MQIKDALKSAAAKLSGSDTAYLDARILLMYILNISFEQLLIRYNEELSPKKTSEYFKLVDRRMSLEPIAYIIGRQEFYGMDFAVDKNILIPRPETELIIDSVLENRASYPNQDFRILDLGTGSGNIAISLAKEIEEVKITAVDISSKALKIARKNALTHNALNQITFLKSDWYKNIRDCKFDFIVSNPPYISRADKHLVAKQTALFEPKLALYAEDDGLAAYREIISGASKFLKNDGKIILEIGFNQYGQIAYLLKKSGFNKFLLKRDLSEQPRVVVVN